MRLVQHGGGQAILCGWASWCEPLCASPEATEVSWGNDGTAAIDKTHDGPGVLLPAEGAEGGGMMEPYYAVDFDARLWYNILGKHEHRY